MRSKMTNRGAFLITAMFVIVAVLIPERVRAQVVAGGGTTINSTSAGYLGITQLRCDCTLRVDPDEKLRFFSFRSDPVIVSVERGGPADGVIQSGDVVTHIDGHSLRTIEGARRFATVQPAQQVELTIARSGRSSKVSLTAGGVDWGDRRVLGTLAPEVAGGYAIGFSVPPTAPAAAPAARPATPRAPVAWSYAVPGVAPTASVAPTPSARPGVAGTWSFTVPDSPASPEGWFGFSFRCRNCGWSLSRGDRTPVFESGDAPPELSMIAGDGPAAKAGLRVGDRLTHIDGLAIASPEGARRLGGVKPGDKVRLTVRRGSSTLNRDLTLGSRPETRATVAAAAARAAGGASRAAVAVAPSRTELRYTGKIDDVSVEVWSAAGSTVEKVGDTMVITVGGTVVRLRVDPKP